MSTEMNHKLRFLPKTAPHKKPSASYCDKCEEIYKYCILNKMELKIITCLYCDNELNEKAFEIISKKFKTELIEAKMSELNVIGHYEKSEKPLTYSPKSREKETKLFSRKQSEYAEEKQEVIEEELLENNEGGNLAEIFKQRRRDLIGNIENRKKKVKEVKKEVMKKQKVVIEVAKKEAIMPEPTKRVERLIKGEKAEVYS